jgi:DNA mismatch repair protein MutS
MGSFVPANRANLRIFKQIMTRIGASDNLMENESTFMVEMKETAMILRNSCRDSLILMDEVGRGTSANDGISLVFGILSYLSEKRCTVLFASHYHELAAMLNLNNVEYYHTHTSSIFKILKGVMDKSHGIECAEQAGLPPRVIELAKETFALLEARRL